TTRVLHHALPISFLELAVLTYVISSPSSNRLYKPLGIIVLRPYPIFKLVLTIILERKLDSNFSVTAPLRERSISVCMTDRAFLDHHSATTIINPETPNKYEGVITLVARASMV